MSLEPSKVEAWKYSIVGQYFQIVMTHPTSYGYKLLLFQAEVFYFR